MTDAGRARPRILLGVTVAKSLILMQGLPRVLAESGWDVHVASNPGAELDRLSAEGITVHPIVMAREPSPLQDLRSLRAWSRLIRTVRPDVVFTGTPKAGLLGMLAAKRMRVPARIYHLRGLRMETSTGWRRRVYAVVERLAISSATETLAVSKSLRDEVARLGLAHPTRMIVLGEGSSNGVDVDRFAPGDPSAELAGRLGIDEAIPVIGYVGRLTSDKGSSELIGASMTLARRGVAHQLLIVGEAEDEAVRGQFLDLQRQGVSVVLTGQVADTAPYYRLMTVFCLPTYREGFPNVVLEATASGVCTVTTDATGAKDSVIDGESGVIVPMRDADRLGAAFADVLADPAKRELLAAAGRRRAVHQFDRRRVQADTVAYLSSARADEGSGTEA